MSSGFKKSLIAVSISGLMASSAAFATNGYFAHGYSTKEKGLAGAGVAHSGDTMAAANNPAGMVDVGNRMDVGAALFNPNRSYEVTGGPTPSSGGANCPGGNCPFSIGPENIDSDSTLFLIPHFGYNMMLDDSSSFGVSIYGNGGMNSNYKGGTATFDADGDGGTTANTTHAGTFGGSLVGQGDGVGVNLAQLFFNFSYAKKVSDEHSVGASLIFAYQQFKADGLGIFAPRSASPANLSNNGDDTSTGFGAKLGWQGKVTPELTLGASYQTEIAMSEFDKYAGLFAEQGDFDIPATLSLGAAYAINDKSTLVLDIQQIYYEDVASIANGIQSLLNGQCTAVPPSGPGTGAGCLGASNGAGFGWEDMTVIKIGYEWMMDDMTMRVGLSTTDQPIPGGAASTTPGSPSNTQMIFNILAPAVVETHITFGMTIPMGGDSEMSFAAMYAPSNDVTGGNAFDAAQTIKLEMDQFEVQGTYTMKF